MDNLLIICGPTATGKTSLALHLARLCDGEIISADSRQVYSGMDIGTGKDIPPESVFVNRCPYPRNKKISVGCRKKEDIPIWLVDIVDPNYQFNVGEYITCAKLAIKDIQKRKKLPIIVGGTGLYIKGILDPFETAHIAPNESLRSEIEKLSREDLARILQKVSLDHWHKMNVSDRLNPRRLIRAIEIAAYHKEHPQSLDREKEERNVLQVGLTDTNEALFKRIDSRVDARVAQGAMEEVQGLLAAGYTWDMASMNTYGYKEWKEYFSDEKTKVQAIQQWKNDEHEYARKQLTWFRKQPGIEWYTCTLPDIASTVGQRVQSWYTASTV
jgi:tRNA dimethylallyltransferase